MAKGEESEYLIEDSAAKIVKSNSFKLRDGMDENSNLSETASTLNAVANSNNNNSLVPSAVNGPVQTAMDTFLLIETPRVMSEAQKELVDNINEFSRRVKKATIDVWWLFDDGGKAIAETFVSESFSFLCVLQVSPYWCHTYSPVKSLILTVLS